MQKDDADREFLREIEAAAKSLSVVDPDGDELGLEEMIKNLKAIVGQADSKAEPAASLVPNLIRISKTTRALMGLKLAELGFYQGQDELLILLDEGASISVSGLAEMLLVRPSTVSKMVDRLTDEGHLTRTPGDRDSRRTMISITPLGLDARSKLLLMHERLEEELTKHLAVKDSEALAGGLAVIEKLLRSRLNRLR